MKNQRSTAKECIAACKFSQSNLAVAAEDNCTFMQPGTRNPAQTTKEQQSMRHKKGGKHYSKTEEWLQKMHKNEARVKELFASVYAAADTTKWIC
jgi:hypothetical protein